MAGTRNGADLSIDSGEVDYGNDGAAGAGGVGDCHLTHLFLEEEGEFVGTSVGVRFVIYMDNKGRSLRMMWILGGSSYSE